MVEQVESGTVNISVRNLGGIEYCQETFKEGVTLLVGRNATNRTSLLRSMAAGLGGSTGELKSDADEGRVTLDFDGEQFTRAFERRDGTVWTDGNPYSEDDVIVDLFSCLLETNPARRAVERGDDLREIIMRPVDTEQLRSQIESTRREFRDVTDRIDEIERRRGNLPAIEERFQKRTSELEAIDTELAELRERVDEYEADSDTAEQAETVVEELKRTRNEYESVRNERQTQQRALESLKEERTEVQERLEGMTTPEAELDERRTELDRLQRRKREVTSTINSLLSIVEFNTELIEDSSELPISGAGSDSETAIDELDPSLQSIECWTCGTTVEKGAIADRLDDLRDVVAEKRGEKAELKTAIDERKSELTDLEADLQERTSLREKLADVEAEIEEREAHVRRLEDREVQLEAEIEELEERAGESKKLREDDLLESYQRLSELEYERGQLEEQITALEEQLAEIEDLGIEREQLGSQREELKAELESLRGRIEDLETSAIDTFNEHVATVIGLLNYENIERVWIERKTTNRRATDQASSAFELHVVRSTAEGVVYDDTVGHLSESERDVIGLVVALAGYLVHEVHGTVPLMLLDSLEAIDADRIAALVEYFSDYAPFLIVALLPEDAEALSDDYERIPMDGTAG